MVRKALLLCALVALLLPSAALAAGKPVNSCPPGFNLGANTVEQWLALPGTQASINDGLTTEQDIRDWFEAFDRNGDGLICGQYNEGWQNGSPYATYYYNTVDDNASVPF
jgi:hypothetical protein